MPTSLLEALCRLARANGYENPIFILARHHKPAQPRRPWWLKEVT